MKCLYCKKEYDAKRSTSRYCSDKCRKLAFLNKEGVSVLSVPKVSVPEDNKNAKVSVPSLSVPQHRGRLTKKLIKDMKAQDLYDEIGIYEHDTWKDSPEYKELMKRLRAYSEAKLKAEGYDIPNWKLEPLKS